MKNAEEKHQCPKGQLNEKTRALQYTASLLPTARTEHNEGPTLLVRPLRNGDKNLMATLALIPIKQAHTWCHHTHQHSCPSFLFQSVRRESSPPYSTIQVNQVCSSYSDLIYILNGNILSSRTTQKHTTTVQPTPDGVKVIFERILIEQAGEKGHVYTTPSP